MSEDKDLEYYRNRCNVLEQLVNRLEEKNSLLEAEMAALKETVSALVARNINAKPDKKTHNNSTAKKKRSSQSSHARKSRTKPASPDRTVTVDQKRCNICGSPHLSEKPTDTYQRIVEDIIPARIITTRYVITRRYCRNCRRQVSGAIPDALPNERFGLRLMVLVVSLKMLGLSYQKISHLLHMIFGLYVTESAINHSIRKVSAAFGKRYDTMIEELKKERNIHGDETSWRINGTNHWLWAFVGKWTAVYDIDHSRGSSVPQKILGDYDGNITSDSWSAWNGVGATHQRCHIHYARELDETIHYKRPGPEFGLFARTLKRILRDSHDAARFGKAKRIHAKKNLARRIDRLIGKRYSERNCIRLVKRLKREKDMLFTFLETRTDYHNNSAERAIRPNVIIRKITNGHRTESGAASHKILMSIRETCRMRGLNFYDYTLEYLGRIASKS